MTQSDTSARRLADLEAENRELRAELARWRTRAQQLDRLADQDPLTGLLNRRAFVRELSRTLAFARRYGSVGSLIYLDVDNLKRINDGHAHAAGDAALLHVADVLAADTRASDVVGRLGGDEFVVLLQQAGADQAERKAAELQQRIQAAPVAYEAAHLSVRLSVGFTTFDGSQTPEAAIDAADRAMYAGRRQRRAGT
jgi:diguanylate cyclase (GGDEF)-like protein